MENDLIFSGTNPVVINYNGNKDDMEANDDQGTDGDIGNERKFNAIKNFASIEYSEKETDVRRIEQYDVQHMLV